MLGCKSATEPSFDDAFQVWAGTCVGADARFQISLQIRRGNPYRSCIITCREYSDLYTTASLADGATGYSAAGTSMIKTDGLFGFATELQVKLIDREVLDTPGVKRVTYTYRGTLQGSQQTTGNVVVMRFDNQFGDLAPISAETLSVTLNKQ